MSPSADAKRLLFIRKDRKPFIAWRPVDERVVWVCVALAAVLAGWSIRDAQERTQVAEPIVVYKDRRPLLQFECLKKRGAEIVEACRQRSKSI